MVGVGIGEEQLELALLQLAAELLEVGLDLARQLLVLPRQRAQLDQVAGPALEPGERLDLIPQLRALARQRARPGGVIPGALRAKELL